MVNSCGKSLPTASLDAHSCAPTNRSATERLRRAFPTEKLPRSAAWGTDCVGAVNAPSEAENGWLEPPMAEAKKARAVGFNHIAIEVGDIEEALAFYARLFDFKLGGEQGTQPCLSGCHPQPLAVVFGHAHGRSPAWQSSVPTIAPRVPATFSRRRGLRRLPGEGSLERRVCLPPLSGGGRAVPLRKSSWRLALPQVPP